MLRPGSTASFAAGTAASNPARSDPLAACARQKYTPDASSQMAAFVVHCLFGRRQIHSLPGELQTFGLMLVTSED
jgi:hypothetical protein